MLKKAFLSAIILVLAFLASGCGTLYKGTKGLAQGVKEGAQEDWTWFAKAANDSDAWVKKNLW